MLLITKAFTSIPCILMPVLSLRIPIQPLLYFIPIFGSSQFLCLTPLSQANHGGETAEMVASRKGHQEIVELLTSRQVGQLAALRSGENTWD